LQLTGSSHLDIPRAVALQDISLSLDADTQLLQQRLEGHIDAIQPQGCPSNETTSFGTLVSASYLLLLVVLPRWWAQLVCVCFVDECSL